MSSKSLLFVFILSLILFPTSREIFARNPILVQEEIFQEAPYPSCHASTILELEDGSLMSAWFGGTQEGSPDVKIWGSRRVKGKWSDPFLLAVADEKDIPCWNPVLFQPKNGPICLFYKVGKSVPTWYGFMIQSHDSGKTWSAPQRLPECFLGPIRNKPIQLADGTILSPCSTEHDGWRIHIERIPSLNKTWSRTESLNKIEEGEAIQPAILTHQDGRLQLLCRDRNNKTGHIWQLWSDDQGITWSTMKPTILPNPNCGIDAVSLEDGRHLLVYNHTNNATTNPRGREMLNVAISNDGIHWEAVCTLENDKNEHSYPAVIQDKNGNVHITYTRHRKTIIHVVLDPHRIEGTPIQGEQWPEL